MYVLLGHSAEIIRTFGYGKQEYVITTATNLIYIYTYIHTDDIGSVV